MIRANTTIIVGEKTYLEGQAVTGLSEIDKTWMAKAGYITIEESKKKQREMPTATEDITDDI